MISINEIRQIFIDKLTREDFVIDKTGSKMIEIIGESFIADQDSIFGVVNWDYVKREIEWYNSCSLNVNDIPGETPLIWKQVSDANGFINSNYGWCIFHKDNGSQYDKVKEELLRSPHSRRATMIYTRPSIHTEYNSNGMSDFICTNTVSYVIRDNKLHVIVSMRSNDAWAGYRNDRAWARYVQEKLAKDLEIDLGNIYWQTSSLHLYERDFWRVDGFSKFNRNNLTKKEYLELIK